MTAATIRDPHPGQWVVDIAGHYIILNPPPGIRTIARIRKKSDWGPTAWAIEFLCHSTQRGYWIERGVRYEHELVDVEPTEEELYRWSLAELRA